MGRDVNGGRLFACETRAVLLSQRERGLRSPLWHNSSPLRVRTKGAFGKIRSLLSPALLKADPWRPVAAAYFSPLMVKRIGKVTLPCFSM